jgi:hypothetical protein
MTYQQALQFYGGYNRHRTEDRATSVEAAHAVTPDITEIQLEVLRFAKQAGKRGFTDVDLNEHFNARGSTYRTRRSELTNMELILPTNATRTYAPSKRRHMIWVHHTYKEGILDV